MTMSQVIEMANDVKPNAFDEKTMTHWVNQVEGQVQTEVFLWAVEQIIQYDINQDADTELLVQPPHDKIYLSYLMAMIDFANGEYNKYANTAAMFNQQFAEFMRWFALTFRPADTHEEVYT